jgi:hypothetical protein
MGRYRPWPLSPSRRLTITPTAVSKIKLPITTA